DYPLKAPGVFGFLSAAGTGIEVGNGFYFLSKDTLQRDLFGFGQWVQDTAYKISFGAGSPAQSLPQEAFTCAPSTVTNCSTDANCTGGLTCQNGWCQPPAATSCAVDGDCTSGQTCPARRCTGSRKPCGQDSECGSGQRCGAAGGLGE